PSRLEVQRICALRLPLSASVALPASVTAVPVLTCAPGAGAVIAITGGVFCLSVRRSCGPPGAASRLRELTESVDVLVRAKLTLPPLPSAAVTSKSTTCFAFTAALVPSAGPAMAGRLAQVVVASGQVLSRTRDSVPPTLLLSALFGPTVRRRIAWLTAKPPSPVTSKRRKACCVDETVSTVALPKARVGFFEST